MLTKRANMTAILEGKQPDYYGDLMDALQVIPDPIFMSDRVVQDGEIHRIDKETIRQMIAEAMLAFAATLKTE